MLVFIMAAAALSVGAVAISVLYRTSVAEQALRLHGIAEGQARLIEAMARYEYSRNPATDFAEVLSELVDSRFRRAGFAQSGSILLGRRDGDQIAFLIRSPAEAAGQPDRVPLASTVEEPLRQALFGRSGTMVGPDARGIEVLAAFEPVALLDAGLVAKMDVSELRAPFIRAGFAVLALSLVVVAGGSILVLRIGVPMARRLDEGERRFHAIFDGTFQFLGLVGADGTLLEVNRTALKFAGIGAPQAVGRPFWETAWWRHSPELQARLRQAVARAAAGELMRFEATHPGADGNLISVDFSLKPAEEGMSGLLIAEGRDITEAVRVREELRLSETRLAEAQEIAHIGNWNWNLENGEVWWSKETYRIFGATADGFRPSFEGVLHLIHAGDREAVKVGLSRALEREETWTAEFRIPRAGEDHRVCLGHGRIIRDAAGRPLRMNGTVRDITDFKRSEAALRQKTETAELLYRVAVAANGSSSVAPALQVCLDEICLFSGWPLGHAYLVSEDDRNRLVPSGVWHGTAGRRFQEFQDVTEMLAFVMGEGLPGRVMAERRPLWIEDMEAAPDVPRGHAATSVGLRTAFAFPVFSGDEVLAVLEFFHTSRIAPVSALIEMVAHASAHLGRAVERERVRKTLLAARDTALTASRAKSEFLASMSHELRTPLNAIIGFADTILAEVFGPLDGAKYREYLADIQSSGHHLLRLINDILDVSAIESGNIKLHLESLDLDSIAAAALRLVTPRAAKNGVVLESAIAPGLPAFIGDERRIKQILVNLLANAVAFTPEGGRVALEAGRSEDGGLWIAVADDGIGMDAAGIEKAMAPFGQVDSSLARRHQGTGLGLPLTRGLVEVHGGTLRIESEPGKGTTVFVLLPAERLVA